MTMSALKYAVYAAFSLVALSFVPAGAGQPDSPVGTWLTQNGHSVVRIEPCAQGVCGSIVGIDRAPDEAMPTAVDGRSQCGLTILTASAPVDGVVHGGITDPRNGHIYNAELWLDGQGRLHLRGYVGIPLLGATQIWQRFDGHIDDACRFTTAQTEAGGDGAG
jgi:uncharacterized protein (DUF2147 family)